MLAGAHQLRAQVTNGTVPEDAEWKVPLQWAWGPRPVHTIQDVTAVFFTS